MVQNNILFPRCKSSKKWLQFVFLVLSLVIKVAVGTKEEDLERAFFRLEDYAKWLAKQYSEKAAHRCDNQTLIDCKETNFASCSSQFPFDECKGGVEFSDNDCGPPDSTCGAFYDFTFTSINLEYLKHYENMEYHQEVVEAVCFSKLPESVVNQKKQEHNETGEWEDLGLSFPSSYFGSYTGVFRYHLSWYFEKCEDYKPRIRPWYVAASSPPKDLVLLLDMSGANEERMKKMRETAIHVIKTLAPSDYFSVVITPETKAEDLGSASEILLKATQDNKDKLIDEIMNIDVRPNVSIRGGFQKSFDTLRNSVIHGHSADCSQRAILLFTAGNPVTGNSFLGPEERGLDLVTSEQENFVLDGYSNSEPFIFTISVGATDDTMVLPKQIACSANGIWLNIKDGEEDLSTALESYYRYFAYHIDTNERNIIWTDLYEYAGSGLLGTTAAVPVFDKTVTPAVLIGVVGVDLTLAAMQKVLGMDGDNGRAEAEKVLDEFKKRPSCRRASLTECKLQSLRNKVDGGLCDGQCAGVELDNASFSRCNNTDLLPFDKLWHNENFHNKPILEKKCCRVGDTRSINDTTVPETAICTVDERDEASIDAFDNENITSLDVDEEDETPPENDNDSPPLWLILTIVLVSLCFVGTVVGIVCFRKPQEPGASCSNEVNATYSGSDESGDEGPVEAATGDVLPDLTETVTPETEVYVPPPEPTFNGVQPGTTGEKTRPDPPSANEGENYERPPVGSVVVSQGDQHSVPSEVTPPYFTVAGTVKSTPGRFVDPEYTGGDTLEEAGADKDLVAVALHNAANGAPLESASKSDAIENVSVVGTYGSSPIP